MSGRAFVLYRGSACSVRFLRCSAVPRAVVCFETWSACPTLDGAFSAEGFFAHRGMNAIGVLTATNDWFLDVEMDEAVAAIRLATAGFDLVGYGGSMGGFAALNFAEALGLRAVIAICPQFSIDPARAPYEQRWRNEAARITAKGGFARDRLGQARRLTVGWLVYDPDCVDARHAADIQAHAALGELRLRFGGHHLLLMLQQAGLFTALLEDMLGDRFDPAAFRRAWREARRGSAVFWIHLADRLIGRGQFAAACRAIAQARPLPHTQPAELDLVEARARIGLGDSDAVRRLAAPWAGDPDLGETARWCLSQTGSLANGNPAGGTDVRIGVEQGGSWQEVGMSGSTNDTPKTGISEDEDRDDALDDTFPASDPISIGGATGPEDKGPADTLEERP